MAIWQWHLKQTSYTKKIKNKGPYRVGRIITGYLKQHPKNAEGAPPGHHLDTLKNIYHT